MKKTLAITAIIAVMAVAGAANAAGKKDPSWTLQVGYSPAVAGGIFAGDEEAGAGGDYSLIGGSFSFDWRSQGRWGFHVPLSVTLTPKSSGRRSPAIGLGVNAALHFRKRGVRFDPYLLMGAKLFVAIDRTSAGTNVGALPMPSVGLGMRGFLSKNVGLYAEVSGQGLPFAGGAVGIVQGSVGVSIRF